MGSHRLRADFYHRFPARGTDDDQGGKQPRVQAAHPAWQNVWLEEADEGAIAVPRNYRIGYVEQQLAFTEETPLAPNSPYSASKTAADMLVRAYHHTYGLPTSITRCSNNYGPYQFPENSFLY
jgi:hypothetical protein